VKTINWKNRHMGQRNPSFLKKIRPNIEDIKKLRQSGESLIDVGCGHGYLYPELGDPYLGVDLFPENIAEARLLHGDRFKTSDLLDLEGQWDFVLCCRVLHHIPMLEQAVEKLRGLTRRLCVLVLPIGEESVAIEEYEGEEIYFQTFSEARMKSIGDCLILNHHQFSTVVYGPRLP
jgi:2-polyprenyl-3-methyl-5-hydroxy-6-metoxy-1,4-benzoquinol methylase